MNSKVFYVLINSNFIKYIISILLFFKKTKLYYLFILYLRKFFIFEIKKLIYKSMFISLLNYKRFNFTMKIK